MAGLKLKAELGGDGSGFDAMMRRANSGVGKFGSMFGGLKGVIAGAFTVGAITNFSNKVIQTASALRDLSDRVGVNVEWLQETGFAAKQAGSSIEAVTKFLDQLAINREQALRGGTAGETKGAAFNAMGISGDMLKKMNLQDIFDQVASAYKTGNQQKLLPALREIGGRSGGELVATFVQGLEENRDLARKAGIVMSEDVVDALKAAADDMTTLGEQLRVTFAPAIATSISYLREFVDWINILVEAILGAQQGGEGRSGRANSKRKIAEEIKRQEVRDVALEEAKKARRKAAKDKAALDREPTDALVNLDPEKKVAKRGGTSLQTDSLVGIGNFLGRNPGLVNSVANQQLTVARQHVRVAEITLQVLKDKLSNPSAATILGAINVP